MIRGHVLVSRIRYLEDQHGPEALGQVLETLPEEDRAQLAELKRDRWYPFPIVLHLDRAVERVLGPTDPAVLERVGEASAREWANWLGKKSSLISVHTFLSLAAERHLEIQTFGTAAYRRIGFTEGQLSFSGYPVVDEVWCRSAIGFLRESVRAFSGSEVRAEEMECQSRGDAACVFRIRWDSRPA